MKVMNGLAQASICSCHASSFSVNITSHAVLSSRFGRLPMVSSSSVLYSLLAVGSCWLPELSLLLVVRFLLGVLHPTSLQSGYILGQSHPRLALEQHTLVSQACYSMYVPQPCIVQILQHSHVGDKLTQSTS